MIVEEFVHITFHEANLELQDTSKSSVDEEESNKLLQGNK